MSGVNKEGMQFSEWCYAAGVDPKNLDWDTRLSFKESWKNGEDPSEYRIYSYNKFIKDKTKSRDIE